MNGWNLKKPQIDIVTYELYEYCIRIHIIPYFEPKKLDIRDVTYKQIQKYFNDKFLNGKVRRKQEDRVKNNEVGLATETLNKHKIIFTQVFKDALCEKIVDSSPVLNVKVPKKTKKESNFYDINEANQLIQNLEGEMLKPIVVIALCCGLRRGEVLGLKWGAINFETNSFRVEHTAVKSMSAKETKVHYKDSTKTKTSNATFPLLPQVKQVLLEQSEKQKANKIFYGNTYFDSEYVFTWDDGRLIDPDYVSKKFKKLIKKYNMPDIHFHNLRHSTASICINNGMDPKSVQAWLRHADVRTTLDIYTHVSEKQKLETAHDVSNMFTI